MTYLTVSVSTGGALPCFGPDFIVTLPGSEVGRDKEKATFQHKRPAPVHLRRSIHIIVFILALSRSTGNFCSFTRLFESYRLRYWK